MGRQIWITDEAVARVLFVKGRSGVDPDCLVAYLEGDDSKPLWIVDGGRGGKVSSAYVCGLGTDSKVRARCIGVTRMEICADCGKEIGMLEPSYYRKGDDDIGRAYHATCGDPY